MWFQVELPKAVPLTEVQFESTAGTLQLVGGMVVNPDAPARAGGRGARGAVGAPATPPPPPPPVGYPRGYKVEVSMDGSTWQPAAQGAGTGASTMIVFPPVQAKFVRITQTASAENAPAWSIQALKLYEAPKSGGK
jgi:hypothetical protein